LKGTIEMSNSKDFNISIDGDTDKDDWFRGPPIDEDAYEKDVEALLGLIRANPAGLLILHNIRNDDDRITIVPYTDKTANHEHDYCNNLTKPKNNEAAAPEGVNYYLGREDVVEKTKSGEHQIMSRYDQSSKVGTGKGSDVTIHFTPNAMRRTACDLGPYASQSDELLVHEFVHALRQMHGNQNMVPTENALRDYDYEEDFLAIVITNIYISAKVAAPDNIRLRASHHSYTALPAKLSTSEGFLSEPENLQMVVKHYLEEVVLYQDLALVDCAFNPIRELVFNGPKYRHPEIGPRRGWDYTDPGSKREAPKKMPEFRHRGWASS
jgi:hypothetical protein